MAILYYLKQTYFSADDGKLSTVLADLKRKQTQSKIVLKVDRSKILECSLPYLKDPQCELHPLHVHFLSGGSEEDVLDLGGPSREFFTLLMGKFKVSFFQIIYVSMENIVTPSSGCVSSIL